MINTCIIASTIGCILIVFLTILVSELNHKSYCNCKGKAKKEKNPHETKSMEPTAFSAFSMATLCQKPSPQPQNNNGEILTNLKTHTHLL